MPQNSSLALLACLLVNLNWTVAHCGEIHTLLLNDASNDINRSAQISSQAIFLSLYTSIPKQQEVSYAGGLVNNRNQLLNLVDKMSPDPDDAILIYYCGHGFMNQQNTPYILPGGDPTPLYLKDILLRVKRKRAATAIVLFDCCQSLQATGEGRPNATRANEITPLYDSLFFRNPSPIPYCIISSGPGETALGAHMSEGRLMPGSIFSKAFLETATEWRNERFTFQQFTEHLQRSVAQEFALVKAGGVSAFGDPNSSLSRQRTQTVTNYRPIEIR